MLGIAAKGMTASRREQILQAVVTTLAGTTLVGSRIWRSRVEALSRDEAPAIVVAPGIDKSIDQDRGGGSSFGKLDQELMIAIAVYVRGAPPDSIADPIEVDVHSKLMADRTIGGLAFDIYPVKRTPQIEEGDQIAGWLVTEYKVRYRTSFSDISAP